MRQGRKWWRDRLSNKIFHQITDRTTCAPAQHLKRFVGLLTQLQIQTPWHLGGIELPGVYRLLWIINHGSYAKFALASNENSRTLDLIVVVQSNPKAETKNPETNQKPRPAKPYKQREARRQMPISKNRQI